MKSSDKPDKEHNEINPRIRGKEGEVGTHTLSETQIPQPCGKHRDMLWKTVQGTSDFICISTVNSGELNDRLIREVTCGYDGEHEKITNVSHNS